jgi:hypothetical protein
MDYIIQFFGTEGGVDVFAAVGIVFLTAIILVVLYVVAADPK